MAEQLNVESNIVPKDEEDHKMEMTAQGEADEQESNQIQDQP
jgi:hypothetical protein